MKFSFLRIAALLVFSAAAHAGTPPPGMGTTQPQPPVVVRSTVTMAEPSACPSPYTKSTSGLDVAKGEYLCIKSDATCPDDYTSNRNQQTGQLTCMPKVSVNAPDGWTPGGGSGVLVFNSIPQPMVKCPTSTPDWQWGTAYYKTSWNRMGCQFKNKVAY